jgi:hypothetical protein
MYSYVPPPPVWSIYLRVQICIYLCIYLYIYVDICTVHTHHISHRFLIVHLNSILVPSPAASVTINLQTIFFSRHTIKLLLRIYTKKIIFCNVVFRFYFALSKNWLSSVTNNEVILLCAAIFNAKLWSILLLHWIIIHSFVHLYCKHNHPGPETFYALFINRYFVFIGTTTKKLRYKFRAVGRSGS